MISLKQHRGFSLVELLAAVAILGTLAAIVIPRVMDRSGDADKNACYVNKGDVELQVQLWYRNEGAWPDTDLSDMLPTSTPAEYDYFPSGAPICPVDGSGYSIDASTHEVVGHDHG